MEFLKNVVQALNPLDQPKQTAVPSAKPSDVDVFQKSYQEKSLVAKDDPDNQRANDRQVEMAQREREIRASLEAAVQNAGNAGSGVNDTGVTNSALNDASNSALLRAAKLGLMES